MTGSARTKLIDDDWRVLRYSAATAMAHLDEVVDEIIGVVRKRRRSRRA
jgi:very-short-patch-repair endonuclease